MLKITTVITTFEDKNHEYLSLAIESLLRQQHVDQEIILVASTVEPPKVPESVKVFHRERHWSNTQNVNFGFKQARPESTLFFTVNDDVIMTKYSLVVMAETANAIVCVLNPISNCDLGYYYLADFIVKCEGKPDLLLKKYMRMNETEGYHESIMDMTFADTKHPMLIQHNWICMYATMMRRELWESLNGYDTEELDDCGVDIDLCMRAKKKYDALILITNGAFVTHFGGVTTDGLKSPEIREKQKEKFVKKWGFNPP